MIKCRDAWFILVAVLAVLVMASAIGAVLGRRVRDPAAKPAIDNLNARIRAWWVMVLVLGGAIMAGHTAVLVLFVFVSFTALREFMTLTPTRKADHLALVISFFIVLPFQYVLIWTYRYGMFAIFVPVYAFLIVPVFQIVTPETKNFLARTSTLQSGLMIAIYAISHIPALLMLPFPGRDPTFLVVFAIVVVESSDVLGYIFGKLFGSRKIAPVLSPCKTVEGLVGGVLGATLLGTSLWRITPFNPAQAAAMSMLLVLMGFVGGLVMSAIKRDRGVKDWGSLMEGHGGMLDRLDSLCFAAPLFFHLTRYFFTVGTQR